MAHVLIYHHLLPSPAPLSCIECSANKILRVLPRAVWNRSCFANWNDRWLSENRFHWEHVKHLVIRLAFINDAGTVGQELLCAKHLPLEILDRFRHFQHNFSTWWIFVILLHRQRAVVALNYKSFCSFYWINPIEIQNLISIQVCSCNRKS
jgi:hypothetical protein